MASRAFSLPSNPSSPMHVYVLSYAKSFEKIYITVRGMRESLNHNISYKEKLTTLKSSQ